MHPPRLERGSRPNLELPVYKTGSRPIEIQVPYYAHDRSCTYTIVRSRVLETRMSAISSHGHLCPQQDLHSHAFASGSKPDVSAKFHHGGIHVWALRELHPYSFGYRPNALLIKLRALNCGGVSRTHSSFRLWLMRPPGSRYHTPQIKLTK